MAFFLSNFQIFCISTPIALAAKDPQKEESQGREVMDKVQLNSLKNASLQPKCCSLQGPSLNPLCCSLRINAVRRDAQVDTVWLHND